MARRSVTWKRGLLLSTVALFAVSAVAQTTADATTGAATTTAATTTAAAATTTTAAATTATSDDDSTTAASGTTTVPNLSTTSAATTGTDATVPQLTDSTTSTAATTYSYAAPTVPDTKNAPFMQTSSLPEGTVFIAVGSILGAFGIAILIWRAVVACLLHRSVKRAALAQHLANDKMAIPGPTTAPFYQQYKDHESKGSLGATAAVAAGRGVRRTNRGPVPSSTPSQTNLFFSPTAGNAGNGGNRSSTFLPSGFYAANQGAGQQSHGHSISMSDLRPESHGSPGLTPHNEPTRRHPQMSTSTLNLNQAPSGRAPSMFLDDLLDENPQQFPPPGGNHAYRQSRERF
ncbi:hypothetical protein PFICI_07907 [Pestalotiopsis fici W106-1]|uniref:Uncharacterized protein n=1 Tax=Pestalotiopsis fici (strain W106-1 / CGMCC3.15140) TaxID=1229662 RepID=W3X2L1_PESFW|nr:uncharacterized protein PFICI_07907 [Pestalotiopsis fici W106-1]ETS80378.1 hypothetical protein PFICI_07907 [Pestalotiopsis fici W106-1]